ncbi:transposase domain-containing protein [Escherichia coli]
MLAGCQFQTLITFAETEMCGGKLSFDDVFEREYARTIVRKAGFSGRR